MKILAITLTVFAVLVILAMFACFFLATWTNEGRWGTTGVILFFAAFVASFAAGLSWTGVDL